MSDIDDMNDLIEEAREKLAVALDNAKGKPEAEEAIRNELRELTKTQEKLALFGLARQAEVLDELSDQLGGAISKIRGKIDNFFLGDLLAIKAKVDRKAGRRPDAVAAVPAAPAPAAANPAPPAGGAPAPPPAGAPAPIPQPGPDGVRTYPMSRALSEADGRDIGVLQEFLNSLGLATPVLRVDCDFGNNTDKAVRAFQKLVGLPENGFFGGETLKAAMARGYRPIDFPNDPARNRDDFPQNAAGLTQPSSARTIAMLGGEIARFGFAFSHEAGGHNWIRYTDGWDRDNLVDVPVDGLIKLPTFFTDHIRVHKAVAAQFASLFAAWQRESLFNRLLTYEGSHAARYKKGAAVNGQHGNLSNHAWGTAIDFNAHWNGFGSHPAAMADRGCVRELVAVANQNGFYWGGRFNTNDGMHFEVAKILA